MYARLTDSDMDRRAPHQRPPAFSDSFLIVPQAAAPAPIDVPFSALRPRFDCAWWSEKVISLMLHISLISLFETIFFFHFVSPSEDDALLTAVRGFATGFETECSAWPANATTVVRDLLALVVNVTRIDDSATMAATMRGTYNDGLQRKSWGYFGGLSGATTALIGISLWRRYKIHWRRVWIENIAMVGLLGVYEYLFFRTIVYNYKSLSSAELKANIVGLLNGTCGIF
jgi:hypothetical protein